MSPRKRNKENIGLPKRWRFLHGAYYYEVPTGLEELWDGKRMFRLGGTLYGAYRTWADKLEKESSDIATVEKLLDRYLLEVVPTKAPKTQQENTRAIKRLRAVYGALPLIAIEPQHIYAYVDKREAKIAAHREVEVLSHAYTKAVAWGILKRHPFKGEVRLESEPSRDRYVEDWEVIEALSLNSRRKRGSVIAVQAYIRVKLLTALRRGDLLSLKVADLREDGIHVLPHKTAKTTRKRIIIQWSDQLHRAIDSALAARPVDISPFVFCTRAGTSYVNEKTRSTNGWDSLWQRFMGRVLTETKVSERFTEHDVRAKCASDAESLEHARQLLAHADSRLTARVYRRKPELVKPGKGV